MKRQYFLISFLVCIIFLYSQANAKPSGPVIAFDSNGGTPVDTYVIEKKLTQMPDITNLSNVPGSIATADINNDGYPDALVVDHDGNKVVLYDYLNGSFSEQYVFSMMHPMTVNVADLNHDDNMDIIISSSSYDHGTDYQLDWYENNGDSTFTEHSLISESMGLETVSIADFNNDGFADIVASSSYGCFLLVYMNNQDGSFSQTVITGTYWVNIVSSGDMNGDYITDIVYAGNGSINWIASNGDGSFQSSVKVIDYIGNPDQLMIKDLNFDGYPDILVRDSNYGVVEIGLNDGLGNYILSTLENPALSFQLINISDGVHEIISTNYQNQSIDFYQDYRDGIFSLTSSTSINATANRLSMADFNHDGNIDIIYGDFSGRVSWLLNGNYIEKPVDPVKTGFIFNGWYTDSGLTSLYDFNTPLTENLTLYAKWDSIHYTVTFEDYNGNVLRIQDIPYGDSATAPTVITRPGFTFTDWDTDFSQITADTTVTAEYTINSYTVTFEDYDNSVISTQTVTYGEGATAPTGPERMGYTFTDWDTDFSQITADTTVKAEYTINSYTVTFKDYDNSVISTQTVTYGGGATTPTDPERTGYTFTSWDTDFSQITADTTVKAEYTINSYTVTFKDYDNSVISTQTVTYGGGATAPTNPERTGYTFTSWNQDFSNITADSSVNAVYRINQYTIIFDSNGGSAVATIIDDYNSVVIEPTHPTKSGYTFNGWYTDHDFKTAYIFDKMQAGDITVYAKWTKKLVNPVVVFFPTIIISVVIAGYIVLRKGIEY